MKTTPFLGSHTKTPRMKLKIIARMPVLTAKIRIAPTNQT